MRASTTGKASGIVVSALSARANFGKLADRVEGERSELRTSLIAYAEGFVSGHDLSRAVSWGQR
jgi:hypothetical protein